MTRIPATRVALTTLLTLSLPAQSAEATDAQQLVRSLNAFGARLSQQASAADANQCLSPASVSMALLMVLVGAGGDTAAEIRAALAPAGLDDARIHAAAAKLLAALRAPGEGIQLAVADDLWPQQGQPLLEGYVEQLARHYGAKVRPLDFHGDRAAACKAINDHVAAATRDRIQDLLSPDAIRPDTRLVLTNALWFKAAWARPFEGGSTRDRAFTLATGEKVQVPTMSLRAELQYARTDTVQLLRLFYEGADFALDLAVPRAGAGLAATPAALGMIAAAPWPAAAATSDVLVLLPRFRIEGRFELRAALEQLGLGKMFSDAADFMAIDGGKGALRVDQVVHRTFIEVGEKGTEAAAATAVVARAGAARTEPILVAADHPFAYQLVDLRTGFVLFTGRVADPRPSGP